MSVAANYDVSFRSDRAFEDSVVWIVLFDNRDSLAKIDHLGKAIDIIQRVLYTIERPVELLYQYSLDFVQYRSAKEYLNATTTPEVKNSIGNSTEVERGNVDVCVCVDASHSTPGTKFVN